MTDQHSLGNFIPDYFEWGSIYSPYGYGVDEIDLRGIAVPQKYDVAAKIEEILDAMR